MKDEFMSKGTNYHRFNFVFLFSINQWPTNIESIKFIIRSFLMNYLNRTYKMEEMKCKESRCWQHIVDIDIHIKTSSDIKFY